MAEEMTPVQRDAEMLEVERELSQLLAVSPSPEFAARVRARLEQQPARALVWRPWLLASGAVVAAVLVAIVVIGRRSVPIQPAEVRAHADLALPLETHAGPAAGSSATPRGVQHAPGGEPVRQRRRPVIARDPEVLIDPALARAVRRLAMEQPVLPEIPAGPSLDPVVVEPLRVPDMPESGTGGSR